MPVAIKTPCCLPCCRLPNAKSVTTALRKVKDLPYNTIANGHGPLLRFNVPEMVGRCARLGMGWGLQTAGSRCGAWTGCWMWSSVCAHTKSSFGHCASHPPRYERWSKAITQAAHSVAVLYASDYGFSDRLSQVGRAGWAPAAAPV